MYLGDWDTATHPSFSGHYWCVSICYMTSSGNLWPYRCPLVINYYVYFRIMIQSSFQSVIMWSVYIVMYVVSFGTLLWTYRSIGKISYYLGNVIYFCVFYMREICLWIQICTSNRSRHHLSWIVEYKYEKYLDFKSCAGKKSKMYKKRKINLCKGIIYFKCH